MDDLPEDQLRGAAFAANLRRAFGAPVQDGLPQRFAVLLDRLSEVKTPSMPKRAEPHRLGA